MPAKNTWTPYGLEAIRIAHIRRRRVLGALLALGLLGMWMFMFDQTTTTQFSISVNGQEQANGIQIQLPDDAPPKNGPVSVSINPGRVTRADTSGVAEPTSTVQRTEVPTFDRANPYNWSYYVLMFGPYALLGAAVWFLAKKRGAHDEVNYGVYKGSMPLEMITKTSERQVFTTRWTKSSIFGKRRSDYLPAEVVRVPQEGSEDA